MNENDHSTMAASHNRVSSRQADLVSRLNHAGFMSVGDLASATGVSEITVRRDLALLERTGIVRRTHGGALGLRRDDASAFDAHEPSFEARRRRNGAAKTRIARAGARLVAPGQSIAIDTGTTTFELARLVGRIADLQVVSNNTRVASVLADSPNPVYVVAGRVRGRELSVYGPRAIDSLRDYSFDTFFLGISGITADGLFDYSPEDAEVKRAFMARSGRVVALCDSQKFNRKAMVRVAAPAEIHTLVCDAAPDPSLARALAAAGVEVIVA
jgi:DeoR family glycerol-3-phosphate regulon repressor